MASKRARELGIDLSSVDLDAINLPDDEDFGILSDDEEELQNEDPPELEVAFGNIIVVDNLPDVPPEKFEKLENVIRKICSRICVIKEGGFWMPVNPDTNMTYGYCFIEYNTPQEAELVKEKTNRYKLDKSHILAINMFDDFERYMKVPDEWMPAEIKPCTTGENLQKWLTDEKARDQIVIHAGKFTEVYWNDARQLKPELVYQKEFWTDDFVRWSPLGTYLATVHRQGSQVWGGEDKFDAFNAFFSSAGTHLHYSRFYPAVAIVCWCFILPQIEEIKKIFQSTVTRIYDQRSSSLGTSHHARSGHGSPLHPLPG